LPTLISLRPQHRGQPPRRMCLDKADPGYFCQGETNLHSHWPQYPRGWGV